MKIKLSSEAKRAVFRLLVKASLARHMARFFTEQGDMLSARREILEARGCLYEARRIVNREELEQVKKRTDETLALLRTIRPVGIQDESSPEQVSTQSSPGKLRLCGVLVQSRAFQADNITRLGKNWVPASILVAHQKRKGHTVCWA